MGPMESECQRTVSAVGKCRSGEMEAFVEEKESEIHHVGEVLHPVLHEGSENAATAPRPDGAVQWGTPTLMRISMKEDNLVMATEIVPDREEPDDNHGTRQELRLKSRMRDSAWDRGNSLTTIVVLIMPISLRTPSSFPVHVVPRRNVFVVVSSSFWDPAHLPITWDVVPSRWRTLTMPATVPSPPVNVTAIVVSLL